MNNFQRLAADINVNPLLHSIMRQQHLWKEDTYLRDYPQGPFAQIETIMLRFPSRSVHETEEALAKHLENFDQHENIDQPAYALLTDARPLVRALMTQVHGERLGRVLINKIRPGGRIFPHADEPVHAEYWDRYHFVLQSTPGCLFRCGDETVNMKTGEVWWFQNQIEHEVVNNGSDDRIHMVVDIRTQR